MQRRELCLCTFPLNLWRGFFLETNQHLEHSFQLHNMSSRRLEHLRMNQSDAPDRSIWKDLLMSWCLPFQIKQKMMYAVCIIFHSQLIDRSISCSLQLHNMSHYQTRANSSCVQYFPLFIPRPTGCMLHFQAADYHRDWGFTTKWLCSHSPVQWLAVQILNGQFISITKHHQTGRLFPVTRRQTHPVLFWNEKPPVTEIQGANAVCLMCWNHRCNSKPRFSLTLFYHRGRI